MITDDDIQKMLQVFATKQELKQEIEKLVTVEEFREKHDQTMTRIDAVFKELKDRREEQTVHMQDHEDIRKDIDDIKRVPVIAHELKKQK